MSRLYCFYREKVKVIFTDYRINQFLPPRPLYSNYFNGFIIYIILCYLGICWMAWNVEPFLLIKRLQFVVVVVRMYDVLCCVKSMLFYYVWGWMSFLNYY